VAAVHHIRVAVAHMGLGVATTVHEPTLLEDRNQGVVVPPAEVVGWFFSNSSPPNHRLSHHFSQEVEDGPGSDSILVDPEGEALHQVAYDEAGEDDCLDTHDPAVRGYHPNVHCIDLRTVVFHPYNQVEVGDAAGVRFREDSDTWAADDLRTQVEPLLPAEVDSHSHHLLVLIVSNYVRPEGVMLQSPSI